MFPKVNEKKYGTVLLLLAFAATCSNGFFPSCTGFCSVRSVFVSPEALRTVFVRTTRRPVTAGPREFENEEAVPNTNAGSGLTKAEAKAIQRFGDEGFDGLCKTCPTRLTPRVETLTEMLMGLSAEDRDEVFSRVGERTRLLEEDDGSGTTSQRSPAGSKTARDVYEYQLASGASLQPGPTQSPSPERSPPRPTEPVDDLIRIALDGEESIDPIVEADECDVEEAYSEDNTSKLVRKLEKARQKLQKAEAERSRMNRLLDVTTELLRHTAGDGDTDPDPIDEDDEEVRELASMPRHELKLRRLEYASRVSKCDSRVAKGRVKSYALSLELSRLRRCREAEAVS